MPTSNAGYWREREEKQREKNIKDEKEYEKRIKALYRQELNAIEDRIYAFYTRYAGKEGITMAEAKRRVSKMDVQEFAEMAAKYVKEKDFSDKANEELRLYNLTMRVNYQQLLMYQIALESCATADELDKFMQDKLEGRTLDEIKRQAGILGESLLDQADMVHSIVNASFHNATFSDRVWANQAMLRSNLSNILTNALIQGRNPRDYIKDIRKIFDVSRGQAERLLRTELARVQSEAQLKSYEKAEFDEYIFHALGDACPVCAALDGEHFKVKDAEPGINISPMHPNCRCSTGPYMDTTDFDEWLDGIDDHGLTFEEWKNRRDTVQAYRSLDKGIKDDFTIKRTKGLTNISASRLDSYSNPVYLSDKAKVKKRDVHIMHKNTLDAYKRYKFKNLDLPKIVIVDQDELAGAFGLYDYVTNTVYYSSDIANREGMASYGGIGATEFHEMWHAKQADNFKGKGWTFTDSNRKEYIQQLRKDCKPRIDKLGITADNVGELSEYAELAFKMEAWDEIEAEYYAIHRKG